VRVGRKRVVDSFAQWLGKSCSAHGYFEGQAEGGGY
jgi:hypothetical protein